MQQDVAVFYEANKPLVIESRPTPEPAQGEVLVRIVASGICDTDARFFTRGIPWMQEPLILGHQIAGQVEKTGPGVKAIQKGDHVIVHFVISCGQCPLCQMGQDHLCLNWKGVGSHVPGGFAQYVLVPEANAIAIPSTLSPEEASLIPCGLGTPYRAVKQAAVRPNEIVVIQRAWVWGLATIQMCHLVGAKAIVLDDEQERLCFARELQADATIDANKDDVKAVLAAHAPVGADAVIDFTGDPEWISRATTLIRRGGRVIVVGRAGCFGGIQVDLPTLMFAEFTLSGAWLARREEVRELVELVAAGQFKLAPLLMHRIQLTEVNEGLEIAQNPSSLGVVIIP
jgi:D-arabinose 1-dehydrogenase-like Zn-dependent alcohol dehydrogenase